MLHELLDFFGRAICHQLEERSLQISGETLSVCARDTGIYIGIFSSLTYLHFTKRKSKITIPTIKVSFFLLLLMVPMMVDGLGSYLHWFESDNIKRLVSGTSFGFVLPYFLYPLLSSRSLDNDSEPCVKGSRDWIVPLIVSAVLGVVVYWGMISYYIFDSFIILTVVIWLSLFTSRLFSSVSNYRIKSLFSILVSLGILSLLSLLHNVVLS
ncbi:DUF2085 domain-containing protein [Neobacillus sp. PS2-9]|uniref:DUF2085 domain-containing protein n=1 Tax=Neobacillus sp. PS2-9 TaxID=3070676 RepID=UPI0027DEE3FF|nr:DUF2085 domain-containing protein [Neobacillus sp. PS2-9]WML59153.1 DUF2085 domain-containing protein [Neobacillus sp. PS2-9]